jgi:hypothetical protein
MRRAAAGIPGLLQTVTLAASCFTPAASFLAPPSAVGVRGHVLQRGRRPAHGLRAEQRHLSLRMGGVSDGAGVTLVVSTSEEHDRASENMAGALLDRAEWTALQRDADGALFQSAGNPDVYLWTRTDSMLAHDGIDARFAERVGRAPRDVLFLSRHASAAGRPALTVHPIGNPGAARSDAGGIPFRCPPPSPRLGRLYRRVFRGAAADKALASEFDVSLEAPAHPPAPEARQEARHEAAALRCKAAFLAHEATEHPLKHCCRCGPSARRRTTGRGWRRPRSSQRSGARRTTGSARTRRASGPRSRARLCALHSALCNLRFTLCGLLSCRRCCGRSSLSAASPTRTRTQVTRPLVLSGHAASLTPY